MNKVSRFVAWLKGPPKSSEDVAAEREAARLRDDLATTKLSTRGPAGERFEAERRKGDRGGS